MLYRSILVVKRFLHVQSESSNLQSEYKNMRNSLFIN